MNKIGSFGLGAIVLFVIASGDPTSVLPEAAARWKSEFVNAPHRAWYAAQRDKQGWSCCDQGDAHAVFDAYLRHGKWIVPIDGIQHEIEPDQLLDGPNPTGHAVVWYDGADDHVTIFCFAPGSLY